MKFPLAEERKRFEDKIAQMRGRAWVPEELLELVARTGRAQLQACAAAFAADFALPEDATASAEAHRQGAPLFPPESLPLPGRRGALLFRNILDLLRERDGALAAGAEAVHTALCRKKNAPGALRAEQAFEALLHNNEAFFARWAHELPDAPALVRFLAVSGLTPSFARLRAELAPRLQTDAVWPHGHCPLCGSPPLAGRLAGKEGARLHTCSLCRLEYRAPRIGCPFCLEQSGDKLAVFAADNQPGYVAHVCRSCNGYIKLADFREYSDRLSLPVLDDLESLPLDLLARREGFVRLTASAWGF